MKSRMLFALIGVAILAGLAPAAEVDLRPYAVTPDVGPYLICAASYTGPDAARKAHDLVLDIRNRYRLAAYVYNRGDKERQAEQERLRALKEKCPEGRFRTIRIEDQFAVLVGGYKDQAAARRALDDIKKLKPSDTRLMNVLFGGSAPAEEPGRRRDDGDKAASYVSPLMDAFVVPNPTTAAVERKAERKLDLKMLRDLNSGEDFSLLKCRQPWTLAIATFQGGSTIQSKATAESFFDKLFGKGGEALSASAVNAHNFAEALRKSESLRKYGLEAYVLHVKEGSLVTVGGFASSDDPRMKQAMQLLASSLTMTGPDGKPIQVMSQLLPQPLPMEVPH